MPRKSVKQNYIYNVLFQVTRIIVPLISIPYISRILEPDGVGHYSFYYSICSYFILVATLGTKTYGQRQISFYQDDRYERSKVFWENLIIRCVSVCISLIAWAVYISWQSASSKVLLAILSIDIFVIAIDISWFFQGLEEFGKTASKSIIFKTLNIILIFLFVKKKSDLNIYVLLLVSMNLLENLSLWVHLPKYICKVPIYNLKPFKNIKTIFSLFIPTVAIQIYTVLDKTMIGFFAEESFENGYYEQAMQISRGTLLVVTAMGTVLAPRTGYYYEMNDDVSLKSYLYQSYRFVWFLATPLSLGLFGIAANMVPWFCGNDFYKMIPVLQILSLLILVIGLNSVTGGQYLIPTEKQRYYTFSVILGAICNFLMNLFLIPKFFALGAASSSVVAETVILLVEFYILRKDINVKQVFSYARNYVVAGLCMFIVLYFENNLLNASLLHTFCMVVSGVIVYFGILILLKDEIFRDIAKFI